MSVSYEFRWQTCVHLICASIIKHLFLLQAGVKIDDPVIQVFNGQEVEVWSRVVWKPKWALTFSEVKRKVSGNCSISQRSTMAIKGSNISLEDLSLDGALIVEAVNGAKVYLKSLINLFIQMTI